MERAGNVVDERMEYPKGIRSDLLNEATRKRKKFRREHMGARPYSKSSFSIFHVWFVLLPQT